jgi:hypothetical protein
MAQKKPEHWPASFAHKHVFTPIATEEGDEHELVRSVWLWCIRCGCLKLGSEVFPPGSGQKMTIRSMDKLDGLERKKR